MNMLICLEGVIEYSKMIEILTCYSKPMSPFRRIDVEQSMAVKMSLNNQAKLCLKNSPEISSLSVRQKFYVSNVPLW